MHQIDRLSKAQRVVVVVALGAAFLILGSYLDTLGQRQLPIGWTGYTTHVTAISTGWPDWLRLIIWLGLTCLWAAVSIIVLRPSERGLEHLN